MARRYGRRNNSTESLMRIERERREFLEEEQKRHEEMAVSEESFKIGKREVTEEEAEEIVKTGETVYSFLYGTPCKLVWEDEKVKYYWGDQLEDTAKKIYYLSDESDMRSIYGFRVAD